MRAAFVLVDVRTFCRLVALYVEFGQRVFGPALLFGEQGFAAAEMRLLEVDQPAETQFEWRLVMFKMNCPECLVEFHAGHDERGLKPRHVGRGFTKRLYAVILSRRVEFIPHLERQFPRYP